MASSKNLFLVVALLVSLALFLSSQAAASEKSTKTDDVEEQEVDAGRCHHGCCRWYNHRCVRCCPSAEEDPVAESKENVEQARCRHGCCRWFHGRCVRCCPSAEEDPVAESKENVEQLRCPHGCCRWFHGRCVRCCRSADEASHAEVKN